MFFDVKSNGFNLFLNPQSYTDKFNVRTSLLLLWRTTGKIEDMKANTNNNVTTFCRKRNRISMLTSAVVKWKIFISSIILLLCCSSHVHAIRKGRLMSPSSFTAMSGDLHVQIQFNNEEVKNTATTSRTVSTTTNSPIYNKSENHFNVNNIQSKNKNSVEKTIMSTLVISKIIDDAVMETSSSSPENNSALTKEQQLLQRKRKEVVQNIPLFPDPRHNITQIAVPCQTFMSGGLYEMQVITNLKTTKTAGNFDITVSTVNRTLDEAAPTVTTTTLMPVFDERLRQTLDVRWPSAEMIVSPVRLRTYPESPVEVTLRFPEVNCDRAFRSQDLPEFWLELVYCGRERSCKQLHPQNITKSNILYAEQVRGYPKQKTLKLHCELFGLAGNYAVQLRPMVPAPNVPVTRRFLSVDWSDKFVFNVYARSIFPCDPHTGIGVLYEYPSCILDQGDRVRVYAKLRADVASLKPPTSLHYVAEQRVVKSQYSLYFNCDLFSEKYVEYCFVYVSQAISGAVADVRMDCVPTLPVSDSDTGGWGAWSEWTPCSTNCLGGTRNRYRFCDSPPPRYGAKFCEGHSVETEKCGKNISDTWDCIYETSGSNVNEANRTEVSQEIGPGCRCGCIVHLGSSKPKRIIAGATQSCPGRSFWLIQVDGEETISLNLNFLRLPCASQYVKVRDGPSLSSTLLVELNGMSSGREGGATLIDSSGAQLLVEFFAGEEVAAAANATSKSASGVANAAICTGGFMANVAQIGAKNSSENEARAWLEAKLTFVKSRTVLQKSQKKRSKFTVVHLSAVIFASIIILISAFLGAQYMVRYHKYHLTIARRRDEGSRLHTPHASLSSLYNPPSRAVSTTTLLSEVIYMVKMRPKHQLRHSILRESVDAENMARETEFTETNSRTQMVKTEEEEDLGSTGSVLTLRNEIITPANNLSLSRSPSSDVLASESQLESDSVNMSVDALKRNDSAKDTESIISSGMSSLCNSPPMNVKRLSKYSDRYDAVTLKIRNSKLDELSQDTNSLRSGSFCLSQLGARSTSASLTNGCYSPAASVVSTATIRNTNPKESKEKQNRKKLLARPGSEFSLGNQEDMELDYYDYNVINAGAAPGSYLGMDPAYLIWIPPFDDIPDANEREDDDKTPEPTEKCIKENEPGETEPLYEEIKMPKYGHYLSPCSNFESSISSKSNTTESTPTSDELSPHSCNQSSKTTSPSESHIKNIHLHKSISAITGGNNKPEVNGKPVTPYLTRKQRRHIKHMSKSSICLGKKSVECHLKSGSKTASETSDSLIPETESTQLSDSMTGSYIEKETSVVKSPSDLQSFLAIDNIQFADESESDHDVVTMKRASVPVKLEKSLSSGLEAKAKHLKLNDSSQTLFSKSREFAL